MPNPGGKNGYSNGDIPDDDTLRAALMQYAKERLTVIQRLARLRKELNFIIKPTKLKQLNKRFKVPTVRKPLPEQVAAQLVLSTLADDIGGRNGTGGIRDKLKDQGWMIPRRVVRETLRAFAPEGLDQQFPGRRRLKRGRLTALGPWHEASLDGHAKLAAEALQMGGVGLPMYGVKDKYSSALIALVTLPNERRKDAIGHFYLDLVEEYGAIPLQLTVDGGSETGEMLRFHKHLRSVKASEIDAVEWPPYQQLPSVRNIAIEGLWHWFREIEGHGLFELITDGKTQGIFDHTSAVHRALFYWIWPVALQKALDNFVAHWNNHTIRSQTNKLMPSGVTPRHMYTVPEEWGDQSLAIPICADNQTDDDVAAELDDLRSSLSMSRSDAFRWVDDEFNGAACEVYEELGSPVFSALTAWDLFKEMLPALKEIYNESES